MPAIIQVENLYKTYRSGQVVVEALRGADLLVEKGEFVAVMGPSGSGKSTLFHIIGGLTPPTSGRVILDDVDLLQLSDSGRTKLRKNKVGFVFQKFNLLPSLTAQDNIDLARDISGSKNGYDPAQFQEIIRLLGIGERLHHRPAQMSGGEQQRVALARALVNHPAVLLADEPTGNLDTVNSEAVLKLLEDLNKRLGQTIVMITHNPEAAQYAHRTVHMRDGKLHA